MKYIPPNILYELHNIKQEESIFKDADAFKRMAELSSLGREVKKKAYQSITTKNFQ